MPCPAIWERWAKTRRTENTTSNLGCIWGRGLEIQGLWKALQQYQEDRIFRGMGSYGASP